MNNALRLFCLILVGSCIHFTSSSPDKSPLIQARSGERGYVKLRDGVESSGELIEVRDSSLTVLEPTRLVLVPFTEIARAEFGLRFLTDRLSSNPSRTTLDYGRSASRFPLGLTGPARDAILQGLGRATVDTLRAARR